MLAIGVLMLLVSLKPLLFKSKKKDWRLTVGLDEPS